MKPTTEELYEQAKRVLRQAIDMLEANDPKGTPFILACHDCGFPFRLDLEVGMIAEHQKVEHGRTEENLTVDLIFIGEGPPPEGKPS